MRLLKKCSTQLARGHPCSPQNSVPPSCTLKLRCPAHDGFVLMLFAAAELPCALSCEFGLWASSRCAAGHEGARRIRQSLSLLLAPPQRASPVRVPAASLLGASTLHGPMHQRRCLEAGHHVITTPGTLVSTQAIRVPREGQLQMMIENCRYRFDGHWRQLDSMKSSPDSRVH